MITAPQINILNQQEALMKEINIQRSGEGAHTQSALMWTSGPLGI